MNIDLNGLKALAEATVSEGWYVVRDIGPILNDDDIDGSRFIVAASPSVVLDLIVTIERLQSNITILSRQSEALHLVGHALGLPAGADVTVDVLPAVRALVARNSASFAAPTPTD